MSLINPAILMGLGLVAVPVILHFLLRSKPKKLLFPALRLIQMRRKQNVRRMRLRHIWLMLLRMAVLALLVFALARPSLPAANYGLSLREGLTVGGIIVAALATYYILLGRWRKQRLSNHVLTYRRSLLRAGTGIGVAILFALLVAWPWKNRGLGEILEPRPDAADKLPVAAVFLFDTSASMDYQQDNKTRLQAAADIATAHLESIPIQSRVAVAETTGRSDVVFQADLVGVRDRLQALKTDPLSRTTLDDLLRAAIARQTADRHETLAEQGSVDEDDRQDRFLREIYIFTDLAKTAWDRRASAALREQLAGRDWLQVYIIDVGVEEPQNAAIVDLKLSKQSLPGGGDLFVDVRLAATGMEEVERVVSLNVLTPDGKRVNKAKATVTLSSDAETRITFPVRGLTGPIVQGEVVIDATDPLSVDNSRFFTVAVYPPPHVLIVADRASAHLWKQALAPDELVKQGRARYRVDVKSPKQVEALDDAVLGGYSVVNLINVAGPTEALWKKLDAFVANGGGLGVFLGMSNDGGRAKVAYDAKAADDLLPAELLAELKFVPPELLDLQDLSHPMLSRFEEYRSTGELTAEYVRRYWRVKPREQANVVVRYTDDRHSPAIVERTRGRGRTVLFTTGVSRGGFNDLPLAGWAFVALAHQMTEYLSGLSTRNFNFEAGDPVSLRLDQDGRKLGSLLLRKPRGQIQISADAKPAEPALLSLDRAQVDQPGNYLVIEAEGKTQTLAGFSLSTSAAESDFRRMTTDDLNDRLGPDRWQSARSIEGLTRIVNRGRIGQEVFPLIVLVMLLAFCGELFVANRFYEAEQDEEHRG